MTSMICKKLQADLINNAWEITSEDMPKERIMPKKGYHGPNIITPSKLNIYYTYDPNGDGSEHKKYETILMKHILEMSYKKLRALEEEKKTIFSVLQKMAEIPQYTVKKCRSKKCDVCLGYAHASQDIYSVFCMDQKMDSNWCIISTDYDGIVTCPKCLEIMVQNKMEAKQ
jgi:hypothetical protein